MRVLLLFLLSIIIRMRAVGAIISLPLQYFFIFGILYAFDALGFYKNIDIIVSLVSAVILTVPLLISKTTTLLSRQYFLTISWILFGVSLLFMVINNDSAYHYYLGRAYDAQALYTVHPAIFAIASCIMLLSTSQLIEYFKIRPLRFVKMVVIASPLICIIIELAIAIHFIPQLPSFPEAY